MKSRILVAAVALLLAACGIAASAPVDNGDGTVTDAPGKLMWQQKDDGTKRSWPDGKAYCEGLSLAGHKDWRLPSLKELKSITAEVKKGPAIDPLFSGAQAAEYWSSTTCTFDPTRKRYLQFRTGEFGTADPKEAFSVRCVRGEQ